MQRYPRDHGWHAEQLELWTKPAPNDEPEFQLSARDSWLTIKAELKRAEKSDRLQRISSRSMLQEVHRPLDWKSWERMNRTLNTQNATALQTWREGAICTKMSDGQDGQHLTCPHCGQPATAVHLLWLCKETQKRFPALTTKDKFELEHGINLEFWAQGLLMIPPMPIATGGASVQGWETWTTHDEARILAPDVVSVGIASASTDSRLTRCSCHSESHTHWWATLPTRGSGGHTSRQTNLGESLVLWNQDGCTLC